MASTVLQLSPSRTARVWLGELPQARYEPSRTRELIIDNTSPAAAGTRLAAVEMIVNVSTHTLYGLLGAELTSEQSERTLIRVTEASDLNTRFTDSLSTASYQNDVRVGLPSELVNFVFEGVSAANERLGKLKAGTMVFNCAAYEPVGSNGLMYSYLSNILVQLLNSDVEAISEEDLAKIFKLKLF